MKKFLFFFYFVIKRTGVGLNVKLKQKLLFVEDDLEIFQPTVVKVLSTIYDIDSAITFQQARDLIYKHTYDLALLDRYLPERANGIDLIPEIRAKHPDTAIVILTSDDNYSSLRRAMALGACDYVIKSNEESSLSDLLFRLSAASERFQTLRKAELIEQKIVHQKLKTMVGNSASTMAIKFEIQKLKGHSANILITGESGTGKELIAELLNQIEGQSHRPFYDLNCSTIPEGLLESELFGHKKGSFTNALQDKKGLFELANGGDLFLDEVADLPLNAQAKLLRVIQNGKFRPLGSSEEIRTNVRIISATNKNIESLIKLNLFREDLYYRLNVIRLQTTPLRERKEDIPDLVQFFLYKYGDPSYSLSKTSIQFLCDQPWRGNIRELKNWIERGIINASAQKRNRLEREDFIFDFLEQENTHNKSAILKLPTQISDITLSNYQNYLENAERAFLERSLSLCSGNIPKTADTLGIARTTLYGKLKFYSPNLFSSSGLSANGTLSKRRGRPTKGLKNADLYD
jgi:DNA-binding NtrC family response regulator